MENKSDNVYIELGRYQAAVKICLSYMVKLCAISSHEEREHLKCLIEYLSVTDTGESRINN